MSNGLQKIAVLLAFSVSTSVSAQNGWHSPVTIVSVYAGNAGDRVAIYVTPDLNYGTCSSIYGLVLDQNSAYFKPMFAIAMTAYTTGKPVSVYTDGSCLRNGLALQDLRLP